MLISWVRDNNNCRYRYCKSTASHNSFLFPTAGLRLYLQTRAPARLRPDRLQGKILSPRNGWPEARAPTPPSQDSALTPHRPQKPGPRSARGMQATSSRSKIRKKAARDPAAPRFSPPLTLPQNGAPANPAAGLIQSVENLNPGSLVERTNQSAGSQQPQHPNWP